MTMFIGVSSEEMKKKVFELLDEKISRDKISIRDALSPISQIVTRSYDRYIVRAAPLENATCGLELDTVYLESCLPLSLLWQFVAAAHCDIRNIKIFDKPEDIHI
jgi:hypothetical protein